MLPRWLGQAAEDELVHADQPGCGEQRVETGEEAGDLRAGGDLGEGGARSGLGARTGGPGAKPAARAENRRHPDGVSLARSSGPAFRTEQAGDVSPLLAPDPRPDPFADHATSRFFGGDPVINMPGGPEIMVILVIALLILGPDQLPKAMRTFGNAQSQIKKVTGGFQAEMQKAIASVEAEVKGATDAGGAEPAAQPAGEQPAGDPGPAVVPVEAAGWAAGPTAEPEPAGDREPVAVAVGSVDRAAG